MTTAFSKPRFEITLNSGRVIALETIFQFHTYSGVLECNEDAEDVAWLNEKIVIRERERILRKETAPANFVRTSSAAGVATIRVAAVDTETLISSGGSPWLIGPVARERTSYPSPPWAPGTVCRPLAWLPEITCRSEFKSAAPAHDAAAHFSSMYIVWFQAEFVFPIDPHVVEQIRSVEWDAQAQDGYV